MKSSTGILLMVIAQFIICGCTNSRKDYRDVVAEWTGKEILFPDSMESPDRERIALPTADFTILSYYDSAGCTGCRMRLQLWEEFMDRVDSVRGNQSVALVILAATKDVKKLKYMTKRYDFRHTVIYDGEDRINGMDRFPDDPKLQTFLLDSRNRVVTIGNPLDTRELANLYLSSIGNGSDPELEEVEFQHDFGIVGKDIEVNHTFNMTNTLPDTLKVRKVITSCECTGASISQNIIPPGVEYSVTTTFHDTVPGEFLRTVTVYFENNKPEIHIELTGEINNIKH